MIRLRQVCSRFNAFINASPDLIDRIGFKVVPIPFKSCFIEAANALDEVTCDTDYLSIRQIRITESDFPDFQDMNIGWKHLKMYNCHFESALTMVQFLSLLAPTLETLVLENVIILKWLRADPIRSVVLPKLRELRSMNFQIDFQCSELTVLELKTTRYLEYSQPARLLTNNRVETLTLTYKHINFYFMENHEFRRALAHIKKLIINCNTSLLPVDRRGIEDFEEFLRLQTNTEEVDIETYFAFDVFVLYLNTILSSMTAVKRLTIRERFEQIYPEISKFTTNNNITELCFERKLTKNSIKLFTKIVVACSRIKKLKVLNFEQKILEDAFVHMERLKSIDALTISLGATPSSNKLVALERVKFSRLNVVNRPDMPYKKLQEQNEFILKWLSGPRIDEGVAGTSSSFDTLKMENLHI